MEIGNLTDTLLNEFAIAIITYCFCYILVLLAIISDLISGVRKAKSAGEVRTSEGYRRTVEKVAKYYNVLFAVSVLDAFLLMTIYIVQSKGWLSSIPLFPIITVIIGIYLAFVEAKSVGEKLEEKERRKVKNDFAQLAEFLKDEDKLNKIIGMLKSADERKVSEKRDDKKKERE